MKINLPLGILLLSGISALATEITLESPLLATAAPYTANFLEFSLPECFEAVPETNDAPAVSQEIKHGKNCGCALRIQLGNDGNDSIYPTETSRHESGSKRTGIFAAATALLLATRLFKSR